MILSLSGIDLSVSDLLNGKINQKNLSEQERYVVNFLNCWHGGQINFQFESSGSTGRPKSIALSRPQLEYSAITTLQYLFATHKLRKLLLCIDPKFIGGTQVIVRSIVANANLDMVSPSANPLVDLKVPIDLISLVPLQVQTILEQSPEKFDLVNTILIGGAELSAELIRKLSKIKSTRFFQTYGMTETASHIALKDIRDEHYKVLGDIEIETNKDNCLKLKGTVTNNQWIQTTDIVELVPKGFKWKGRSDWVINSGGIKFSPEDLENRILEVFPQVSVVISSLLDSRLGEKLVLVSTHPILAEIEKSQILSNYELPKCEYILNKFPKTMTGKLNRLKVKNWVRNQKDKAMDVL